ncbi:hypothetical protein [Sphingomonas sp.]|uniref:hypothetical protein n=1 Tax=Sphingomonas sp. TaxID=28214 RepID=UPI0035BBC9CC
MSGAAWVAAAVALAVAVMAGLADRGRKRRSDLDRIGWVDWRTVQMLALMGMAISVAVAVKG